MEGPSAGWELYLKQDECFCSPPSPPQRSQCTLLDFGKGLVDEDSLFGGGHEPVDYCCSKCPADSNKICCPSKTHDDQDVVYEYPNDDFHNSSLCPPCRTTHTCHKGIRINDVQATGDRVDMIIRPTTTYAPSWPDHGSENQTLDWKGYMYTGMKSGREVSNELVQINLCSNKYMKVETCFMREDAGPVLMNVAPLMLLDFNHQQLHHKNGPSAIQFTCTGGTFYLFGDRPYVSGNAGAPIAEDPAWTKNGQTRYTYACPDSEPVTIWSAQDDKVSGNDYPNGVPITDGMTETQENEMIVINYVNVECAKFTLATLPPRYHQEPWTHAGGDPASHPGFEVGKSAADGGHPLNGTTLLEEISGVWSNDCKGGRPARNFLITSYEGSNLLDEPGEDSTPLSCTPPKVAAAAATRLVTPSMPASTVRVLQPTGAL